MSKLGIDFRNGVDRSNDELRLGEGFARVIENAVFLPDDPDRLYKTPGRTVAASLSSPQSTTPKGLNHFQFDNASNQLVLYANGQLYRQNASTSLGSWTSINDLQGSPAAFSRTGDYLKSIPDGLNRWVSYTGAINERPLIHDEDGNTRFLSLKKPGKPTLTALTTSPTFVRPTSSSTPATVSVSGATYNVGNGFENPANAYDNDFTTAASRQRAAVGTTATDWIFSAGGTTSSQKLFVHLNTSSTPPYGSDPRQSPWGSSANTGSEALQASMIVQISTNGGTTYATQIFSKSAPVGPTVIESTLADGLTIANFRVRVILRYPYGSSQVIGNVVELYLQGAAEGRTTALADGTYYYAQTEVYQVTLASGEIYEVESAPSDTVFVTLTDNTTVKGVQVTLSAQTNLSTDGVAHSPTAGRRFFRRLYRSTKSGVWPDLGFIGDVAIDATTFTDTFTTVSETTLGAPSIYTGFAGSLVVQIAGQAPSFYDSTVTSGGLIVAIPTTDRHKIQWCMPGQPDYWPLPAHDLALLPSLRNDNLQGVVAIGDAILVFLRTRVVRLIDLPIVNQPNFDVARIKIDLLSPNEGLAGTPKSYCAFESQKGRAVVAWVSDNGIWMTDGSLLSERGLGVAKLSVNMDWEGDVDKTRLDETELAFDPVLQMLTLDYYDQAGNQRTYNMHTHPDHWVDTGQDMAVPKVTGPNPSRFVARSIAEMDGGGFNHWTLSASSSKIYNERTGTDDAGSPIVTHIESGWNYWAGAMEELHIYFAGVYHNDWGKDEACDLEMRFRRDKTGIIQTVVKRVLLSGTRITRVFVSRAGQSVKTILRHVGKTVSSGSGMKAFGPIALDPSDMGEVEKD